MKMLLRDMGIIELSKILARHKRRSHTPYLTDAKCVAAARRLAKQNGTWDRLTRQLDPAKEIPVLKRSDFRNYVRNGNRTIHQDKENAKAAEVGKAMLALWLDHPKADLDYLQDLLWSYCDDLTWVMAAHEYCAIDLGSSAKGLAFAEAVNLFKDRLEGEVKERLTQRIEERIFEPFVDPAACNWWRTSDNNWNHVCNANVISAALHQIHDPVRLAAILHTAINNMTYAIDGFADDGGCWEGPGYWGYGFGHYMYAAHALHLKTRGKIDIASDDKIARISEYPLAADLASPLRTTFADSGNGYVSTRNAMVINYFFDIPELYDLCQKDKDGKPVLEGMHELGLAAAARCRAQDARRKEGPVGEVYHPPMGGDVLLPAMGQVKMNGKPGRKQLIVAALAGNNGVQHNHNDVGSFIVYRDGRMLLTDPGGPVYTAKTFSPRRYEIVFCNSRGHSVPVINGKLQSFGSKYHGTLRTEGLNTNGTKTVTIDMAEAYPEGTVEELVRTITLETEKNTLSLQDDYDFQRKPRSLEEAFITFEKAKVAKNGRSVSIGPRDNGLTVSTNVPGKFLVTELTEESKEGRQNRAIKRITFTSHVLSKKMALKFDIG